MKNDFEKIQVSDIQNVIDDYKSIVEINDSTVIINIEWTKDGDVFQQFSMYDSNYVPVKTLGETTLIN